MLTVEVNDEKGNGIKTVIPEWWFYDEETMKLFCDLDNHLEVDQIYSFEPSELENAKLAFGNDHTYLLWDEQEIHQGGMRVVTVENWSFQTAETKTWKTCFYLFVGGTDEWWGSPDWPTLRISGTLHAMHSNRSVSAETYHGSAALLMQETSRLIRIIPIKKGLFLTWAENGFIFFLKGNPVDFNYDLVTYL